MRFQKLNNKINSIMETVLVQIKNNKAYRILEDLEDFTNYKSS